VSVSDDCLQILAETAHGSGADLTRAVSDLRHMAAMCRSGGSAEDQAAVARALQRVEEQQNKCENLVNRRVVGVTCAASGFNVLEDKCVDVDAFPYRCVVSCGCMAWLLLLLLLLSLWWL
jgi:hypothetical protein